MFQFVANFFKDTTNDDGKIKRKEFLLYFLFLHFIIALIILIIIAIEYLIPEGGTSFLWVSILFALPFLVNLWFRFNSLCIQRLRDIGYPYEKSTMFVYIFKIQNTQLILHLFLTDTDGFIKK